MKKTVALLSAAILSFSSVSITNVGAVTPELIIQQDSEKVGMDSLELTLFPVRVVNFVNIERQKNGLPELKMFPRLSKVAHIRAQEVSQYRSHTRPNGEQCFTIFDEYGLRYESLGENFAYGYTDPEAVVKAWMDSKVHRDNILNPNYDYLGVGVVEVNGRLYWTQLFLGVTKKYDEAFYPRGYGDLNTDGIIDSVDASMILRDYASVSSGNGYTLSTSQRGKSDMNGDELMDAVDASLMLKLYARNST
jgi:uncharacterized protein YkwD